jgi:hypothetical protein
MDLGEIEFYEIYELTRRKGDGAKGRWGDSARGRAGEKIFELCFVIYDFLIWGLEFNCSANHSVSKQ